jgi:pentachlorophenol monooxygenase/3-(3-hydroxy-phenyl)propionate hydroxylase
MTMPRPVLIALRDYAPDSYQSIMAQGTRWTKKTTYFGSDMRHMWTYNYADLSAGDPPPFINIAQYLTVEALLAEAATKPDLISIQTGQEAVSYTDNGDCVNVVTSRSKTFQGRFLIACDGVRSTIRKQTGIELVGSRSDCKFIILDITADLPMQAERRYIFNAPECRDGGGVLIIPAELGIAGKRGWRIDFQLNPSESEGYDVTAGIASGDIDRRLRAIIGDVPYEIVWSSAYYFNQKNRVVIPPRQRVSRR